MMKTLVEILNSENGNKLAEVIHTSEGFKLRMLGRDDKVTRVLSLDELYERWMETADTVIKTIIQDHIKDN